MKIFPQPATTSVLLEWPAAGGDKAQVRVWNMAGQLVLTQSIDVLLHRIQLIIGDWAPGMYRISVGTERGIWQEKMLKI